MKTWHKKTKNIARIIIAVFLLSLTAVALFLTLHKFFPSSPLTRLSAENVTFIAVVDDPNVLEKMVKTLQEIPNTEKSVDALSDVGAGSSNNFMEKNLSDLLGKIPKNTSVVGYRESLVAVFNKADKACNDYVEGAVLVTEEAGMCILHTSPLSKSILDTKDGSIVSQYGGILPDNVSGVKLLITENFPLEETVTRALGGVITPEVLLARAMASKHYPVMMHITQGDAENMQIEGYVIFGDKNVPTLLQSTKVSSLLAAKVPKSGAAFVFPLGNSLYEAWNTWVTLEFGEDVQRMFEHVLLATTEPLTPVGMTTMPEVSVLLEVPMQGAGVLQATLADVSEVEREQVQELIEDSLTFLYGLTSQKTTLPDRSSGILVTASREAISTEKTTMSGETMTTYLADEEPRLETSERDNLLYLTLPGTMSGTVLTTPNSTIRETLPSFPVPTDQIFIMKLPLLETQDLYAGFSFLPDRLKFDIALTARP